MLLYWQIGRDILERQADQVWGAKVVNPRAHVVRTAYSEMKGFSPRNLKYMRAFVNAWSDRGLYAAGCCTIALGHNPARTWHRCCLVCRRVCRTLCDFHILHEGRSHPPIGRAAHHKRITKQIGTGVTRHIVFILTRTLAGLGRTDLTCQDAETAVRRTGCNQNVNLSVM